jgi:hypothetical protein
VRRLIVVVVLAARTAVAQPEAPAPKKHAWVAQLTSIGALVGSVTAGMLIAGDDAEGTRGDIGISLTLAGLVLGPTAGHWYVGDEIVTTGLCLRLGAFAAIPAIMIFDPYQKRDGFTGPVIATASILFVTGIVWDHATLPRAVRRHNRAHVLVPIVTSNGLAIAGSF